MKYPKKVATYIKVTNEHGDWKRHLNPGLTVKQYLKKGIRLMHMKIRMGYDNEDIIKNLITIIVEWKPYKVPRFISKHLLK